MYEYFIVGCSRSGTSIVQKYISEQKSIYSLPETAFFSIGNDTYEKRVNNINRLLEYSGCFNNTVLHNSSVEKTIEMLKFIGIDISEFIDTGTNEFGVFKNLMEYCAKLSGYKAWVEKTPLHFYKCHELLKAYPKSQIFYVLRHGMDVVASIKDRALKYDEFQHQNNIEFSVGLWNKSVQVLTSVATDPRVHIIDFEKFTSKPEFVLDLLSNIDDRTETKAVSIVNKNEKWKNNINGAIKKQPSKAKELLSEKEQRYAESNLLLSDYRSLLNRVSAKNVFGI